MVAVTFRCGHAAQVDPAKTPRCATCGDTVVARCPAAPRFVGHVRGPSAVYRALEAVTVDLRQKDQADG